VFCTFCGIELPDDSRFCKKCGFAFGADESQKSSDHPTGEKQAPSAAPGVPFNSTLTRSNSNFGTFVFGGLSVLTLAICFAKGIVPIYLAEAALWAALAWFWHKKHVTSPVANGAVLLLAVALAAAEGFLIGRQPAENYKYLQTGNAQFRVNERSGRTDRLTNAGWRPISFDKPAEAMPRDSMDFEFGLGLMNGTWIGDPENAGPGEICYDLENKTDYVLRDVTIEVDFEPTPPPGINPIDLALGSVVLRGGPGGLLDTSATSRFCGAPLKKLPDGSKWSSKLVSATGWKVK
jgi:hypothetical protein